MSLVVATNLVDCLPEACIAKIISLTSPRDASRLTLVSPSLRSVADSDAVWERFLPFDCQSLISRSDRFEQLLHLSKKQLYLRLCDSEDEPVLIDDGNKSFFLDKWNGKKCYMISAKELYIEGGDSPAQWKLESLSESRFTETAVMQDVNRLDIRCKMDISMLSSNTKYTASLVFNFSLGFRGFDNRPVEVSVGVTGREPQTRETLLDTHEVDMDLEELGDDEEEDREFDAYHPIQRRDGWLEVEMGEYFSEADDGELEISMREVVRLNSKRGLIIEGIEIRTKEHISFELEAPWTYLHKYEGLFLYEQNGKRCCIIPAKELTLDMDTPKDWMWKSLRKSRFTNVAILHHKERAFRIDISCKFNTSILTKGTNYAAYFLYKLSPTCDGLDEEYIEVYVTSGGECRGQNVFLDRPRLEEDQYLCPIRRRDGWLEVAMGELFTVESNEEIEMGVREMMGYVYSKQGLIIEGIEVRPKEAAG